MSHNEYQIPESFKMPPEVRARLIKWAVVILILLFAISFGSALLRLQADYWWYSIDANASVIFSTQIRTRLTLFAIGFLIATPLLIWNIKHALSAAMVLDREPTSISEQLVASMLTWTQDKARRLVFIVGPILGFFFGLSLAGGWERFLLYRNTAAFGQTDPIFGKDYGFFVFELPFLTGIVGWFIGLAIISGLIAGGIYYGVQALAVMARMPLTVPSVRTHISIIAGTLLLLIGLALWLNRYEAVHAVGERFTGAGYTDLQILAGKTFTAYVVWAAALLSFLNAKLWRPYFGVVGGVAAAALVYFASVIVWPGIVQTYRVNPNAIELESPYISRAIAATRWGYALDRIEIRPFEVDARPTAEDIDASRSTIENMRLWDPEILRRNVDGLQSLRDYYAFQDMDVDRYVIDGRQRMVMVGARDLVVEQVDPARRNWQNMRLQFTHGNGVVVVPVNEATAAGMPTYLLHDIPPSGAQELAVDEHRLYYSDVKDTSGAPSDRYVFVRSRQPEFDYTTREGEAEHRWTHDGGIPVAGTWRKLVYSFVFGDKDVLFSRDILPETRLLYRRNVRDRAHHILPFLKWDSDPYITIVDGRLLWIMDGFTTTDKIPYSAMSGSGPSRLNYIRNSVKFTIDAYTGEWNAYVVEPDDPLIQAYGDIYPGLLRPVSEAPEEVSRHFRYPEDMFRVQSDRLLLYHVSDPRVFFRRDDAWQIPEQTDIGGSARQMAPYYVQMKLPDEDTDAFVLILPFSPVGRPNMISWLAAHCDPEFYGQLVLYTFPRDRNIDGPAQREAQFEQHAPLTREITLLGQGGSQVRHGNLLVVPIGRSVMYVKPLFLESDRPGIRALPELKLVVLAFTDRIIYAESYPAALQMLFGDTPAALPPPDDPDAPAPPPRPAGVLTGEAARTALRLLEEGKQALAEGDWARYGESQRRLEQLLREAIQGD